MKEKEKKLKYDYYSKELRRMDIKKIPYFLMELLFILRVQKPMTRLFGQKYIRSRKIIELDITYKCNLNCVNCNRSCRQAPSNVRISVEQVKRFIKESIDNDVKWELIKVLGGEPTLHPNILEILNLLLEYKRNYSPKMQIQLFTNGFGKIVNNVILKIPKEIDVQNTSKKSVNQFFTPFNLAPKDFIMYKSVDYTNGCWILPTCGISLTPYGYYPCSVAGGIDRVFGFDIGRKKLPSIDDSMTDQLQVFCKLCGHFRRHIPLTNKEIMSSTWKKTYKKYKKGKPKLSLY